MPKPKNLDSERFSFAAPKAWWPVVDGECRRLGKSVSEYLRDALREKLERNGLELPPAEPPKKPGRPRKKRP